MASIKQLYALEALHPDVETATSITPGRQGDRVGCETRGHALDVQLNPLRFRLVIAACKVVRLVLK